MSLKIIWVCHEERESCINNIPDRLVNCNYISSLQVKGNLTNMLKSSLAIGKAKQKKLVEECKTTLLANGIFLQE